MSWTLTDFTTPHQPTDAMHRVSASVSFLTNPRVQCTMSRNMSQFQSHNYRKVRASQCLTFHQQTRHPNHTATFQDQFVESARQCAIAACMSLQVSRISLQSSISTQQPSSASTTKPTFPSKSANSYGYVDRIQFLLTNPTVQDCQSQLQEVTSSLAFFAEFDYSSTTELCMRYSLYNFSPRMVKLENGETGEWWNFWTVVKLKSKGYVSAFRSLLSILTVM